MEPYRKNEIYAAFLMLESRGRDGFYLGKEKKSEWEKKYETFSLIKVTMQNVTCLVDFEMSFGL